MNCRCIVPGRLCSTSLVIFLGTLFLTCVSPQRAFAVLNTVTIQRGSSPNGPIDGFIRTSGTFVTAQNFGASSNAVRNSVTFSAAGIGINPAGTNWATVGGAVDVSLGGYAAIDPLFFSEIWGNNPVTLTYSNLNPARVYLVQMLHGEPRSCCAGNFSTNVFVTSSATLPVPAFSFGNSVAGENPPNYLDRAIVEVELTGITYFNYRMYSGDGRGGSIAGFQVRDISAPLVTTLPATTITSNAAVLNATVDPNNTAAKAYFQFGTTTNYGSFTVTNNLTATNIALAVSNSISGLSPGTTYHFRVVGTSSLGTNFGTDLTFTTSPLLPTVTTLAATTITTNSAMLNGTVNPGNGVTAAYFQYGLTTNYGSFTATNLLAAGNTTLALTNTVTGLAPETTYQFRLVASNSSGLVLGTNLAFKTARLPIIVVTNGADSGPGSLRQAILDSVSGDTILFDASLSGTSILLTSGHLLLTNILTIDASTLSGGIQLNGNSASRIFQVASGATVVLNALTLTNGSVVGNGGGFGGGINIVSGGSLTLNNSTITGCQGNYGGGIFNGAALTVNNSTIMGCSASYEGGAVASSSFLRVNNSTFTGCAAAFYDSAGISTWGGMSLSNSIVAGNAPGNIFGGYGGTNNLTSGDPQLAPLGNYGGPTPTMPPLPGSPAIDAGNDAAINTVATDQRGYSRKAGAHVDIGAVELQTPALVVTTNADSGAESLRQLVSQADVSTTITFAPGLSGQTILLTNGQISLSKILTLDGSTLTNGIALNGNAISRIFEVSTNAIISLNALTLTNGLDLNATALTSGAAGGGGGGAIRNGGTLTMNQCRVAGNQALFGGGLRNEGTLTVNQSTVRENSALGNNGGGINNAGALVLNQSSISGNVATNSGGGIRNAAAGSLSLNQCTISGNSAPQGAGLSHASTSASSLINCTLAENTATNILGGAAQTLGGAMIVTGAGPLALKNCTLAGNTGSLAGGGFFIQSPGNVSLQNVIIADNSATLGPDIYFGSGTIPRANFNLIGDNSTVTGMFPAGYPNANGDFVGTAAAPLASGLAPLGNYGGTTETMLPLAGSPAIDNGSDLVTNTVTVDQRGLARLVGFHVDLGATEFTGLASAPLVVTQPASVQRLTVATLNATVTPNSAVTTCYFQYGTSTNYGSLSPSIQLSSGSTSVSFVLTNLEALTTYHFRAVASNSFGTVFGTNLTFFTVSYNPVVVQEADANGSVDLSIRTNGLQLAAANFGSLANVVRNGVTFPAAGLAGNPVGSNWAAVGAVTDSDLGGYANIDPLFFSELWGGEPITVTCSNLNPARIYLVQVLHGEPRSCCAGSFFNNYFSTSANATIPVPAFTFGNGIAGENPPNNLDRAIVEVELTGITSFSYLMWGGSGRGPSIAGFQLRDLQPAMPGSSPATLTGLTQLPNGTFQFSFTNQPGASFTVFTSTNVALPANEWLNLGAVPETPPGSGQFQFTDLEATNHPQRYYRVRTP